MVKILDALSAIDPSDLSYQEWVDVGMALKHEGLPCSAWEEWSRNDRRYHPGECERKWETFQGSGITAGTVVQMAKERGWSSYRESRALDWNDVIELDDDGRTVDLSWIERSEVREPSDDEWDPVKDITTYLETLFEPSEVVGYVMQSFDNDGKFVPKNKGAYDRTAGELIQELKMSRGDIGAVFGDYDPRGGAWIRFNPLDGQGVKNANVTDFRYALVESDSMDIGMQKAVLEKMELPVAAMVYSGGKSIHAIVRIDAVNDVEYRSRVEYLYKFCRDNNFNVDSQNKNPSRLSRMPGINRGGYGILFPPENFPDFALACLPIIIRSFICSRSNWANVAMIPSAARPNGVSAEKFSFMDTKSTPFARNTFSMRYNVSSWERERRSSL